MGYNWDYLDKKTYNNRIGKYKFRRQYQFITENGKNSFENILDIAGGSGRFAIPLCEKSEKITVLDLNADALQLLRERKGRIKTIHANFTETEIEGAYSLILCIEALGYFPDAEEFFVKVRTLLNDDGRFIFSYQNPASWRFQLRKLKHWKTGFYHYKEMELDQIRNLLKKNKFEIVKMEGMNWMPFPLASNSIFVPLFDKMEKLFALNKWYSQSPWILFSIRKSL